MRNAEFGMLSFPDWRRSDIAPFGARTEIPHSTLRIPHSGR